MATPLPYDQAVDIGGGRGRLAPAAASSLARIDRQIGHFLDINEAWRSPAQADANYAAYLAYRAYVNGTGPFAPWAPIALPANASIHCIGFAIDTDEQIVGVLNDHGWFQTVYRDGQLVEPWHFEYQSERDNHLGETAAGGSTAFPTTSRRRRGGMSAQYFRRAATGSIGRFADGVKVFGSAADYNAHRNSVIEWAKKNPTLPVAIPPDANKASNFVNLDEGTWALQVAVHGGTY